jgi:N-methylhydantoinase B
VKFSSITVGIFSELFSSIAEEMGAVLERASFSQNIKERRDYSCAVFDANGGLVAQAAHIPVHLGAMEFLMKSWLAYGPEIVDGNYYITNDPYFAGTHLPDISVLRSVEVDGNRVGYVATRAHHADVGGSRPGSIAPCPDVHCEGVIIPPQEMTSQCLEELLSRARGIDERTGDLDAQRAATDIGARRLAEMAAKFGDRLNQRFAECVSHAEAMTRSALSAIPAGEYRSEDAIEGISGGASIRLTIRSDGNGNISFDFSGTDVQKAIGINATEAVTRSACYYVVRCLSPDSPTNGGCWVPVSIFAPPGSLVNAVYPAPVVAGNTEMSQRIVDAAFRALSAALPARIPACSQGTMNNVAFGGDDWAYYETIGGGAGGGAERPGESGLHTHMTNTRNTPAEALEIELPIRIRRYQLRDGSGGRGLHPGGMGVVREFEALDWMTLSLMADRRLSGPPGAAGGLAGATGRDTLNGSPVPAKSTLELRAGDRFRVETPGGGGWGRL